jgi:ribonuclease P protein subunit POP4
MRGDIRLNVYPSEHNSKAYRDEFIGKSIRVSRSSNPSEVGLTGYVVDESRNMLVIDTETGEKKLIKKNVVIEMNGKIIYGKDIVGRPEDRIKR